MTPSSMALYALSSQCPGSSHIWAVVGYDEIHGYPFVIRLDIETRKAYRWDDAMAERLGSPILYHSYDAAFTARKKASDEIIMQGRELTAEVEASLKKVSR